MPDDAPTAARTPATTTPPHSTPPDAGDAPASDLGIVDGLVQLSFLVQEVMAGVAAGHELSVAQLRLIGILRDRTPLMRDLARHLKLDKSSMTGLVDRAERRDLVRRTVAPHDKRAFQVSLTERGRALAHEGEIEVERRITALTEGLSEAQRAQLSLLAGAVIAHHGGL
ncbi:MarR family winged helix-turn-helix transcriptional regulator [Streptomyces sp. NPDC050560]|uniref:MarR family winged helix-turn-helix transcriptional regulator n=1 Tax=Streptomyces sp. NPDC050560 TaxID=3365630 RepID=UPI00378A254D